MAGSGAGAPTCGLDECASRAVPPCQEPFLSDQPSPLPSLCLDSGNPDGGNGDLLGFHVSPLKRKGCFSAMPVIIVNVFSKLGGRKKIGILVEFGPRVSKADVL